MSTTKKHKEHLNTDKNIIDIIRYEFGSKAPTTLKIKIPNSMVDLFKDHKIEMIDYSYIQPNLMTLFLIKTNDKTDIVSTTFVVANNESYKNAFKKLHEQYLNFYKKENPLIKLLT